MYVISPWTERLFEESLALQRFLDGFILGKEGWVWTGLPPSITPLFL